MQINIHVYRIYIYIHKGRITEWHTNKHAHYPIFRNLYYIQRIGSRAENVWTETIWLTLFLSPGIDSTELRVRIALHACSLWSPSTMTLDFHIQCLQWRNAVNHEPTWESLATHSIHSCIRPTRLHAWIEVCNLAVHAVRKRCLFFMLLNVAVGRSVGR